MLQGYGDAIGGEPRAGRGRRPGPRHAGRDRGRVAERLARALAGGAARHGDRERRAARQRAARPLEADRGPAEGLRRPGEPRGAAQGPDHELQPHDGRARRPSRTTCRPRSALLPRVLAAANPTFDNLNAAFPPLRAFSREILPGVRETPATIAAVLPLDPADPAARLAAGAPGPRERPPAGRRRPGADHRRHRRAAAAGGPGEPLRARDPAAHRRRGDPGRRPDHRASRTTRSSSRRWSGLSGESQNFDGNGQYTRFQPGGGDQTVSTGHGRRASARCSATRSTRRSARARRSPGQRPPYRRDLACHRNSAPDLDSAAIGGGP